MDLLPSPKLAWLQLLLDLLGTGPRDAGTSPLTNVIELATSRFVGRKAVTAVQLWKIGLRSMHAINFPAMTSIQKNTFKRFDSFVDTLSI